MNNDQVNETFLNAGQVCARYGGASHMWIVRRLADESEFPKPIYLGRLRHWRLSDLVAWELAQAAKPAPAAPGFKPKENSKRRDAA